MPSEKITPEIISLLINLGKEVSAKTLKAKSVLSQLVPFDYINRTGPYEWEDILEKMLTQDLVYLMKGITLAEKEHKWCGGSAASGIWIYRVIENRSKSWAEHVADWVLANKWNCYLPFGHTTGARSLVEYHAEQHMKWERQLAHQEEQRKRQEIAAKRKSILEIQRNNALVDRRSDVRDKIIQEFNKLSPKERLERVAADQKYSANFYPTRCVSEATPEVLRSLSEETRFDLIEKLRGRQKGPWGKMKRRLWETWETESET